MSETTKPIKVVDRRMFTADGEIREEHMAEQDSAEAQAPSAPPEPIEAEPPVPTNQAFLRLLDMLGQTASLYLQGAQDPATGRKALAAARDVVESLMALREKTRGHLSFEETDALEGLVGELQMIFSRIAAPPRAAPPVPLPPGARRRG